ncbi:MAG: hypothetical protein H6708_23990 [Kofleriaceae bacterium]|nr:hypothetical protein [Myxococcales bacterium]MCB9563473.1 hypothetical protein [Kofleriaceae bacterium]
MNRDDRQPGTRHRPWSRAITAVADAITWGAGMGLLPPFLGEPGRAQGTLVRLHDPPIATLPVHALYHASQRDDVRVRVLVDELEAQLRATV